MKKNANRKRRKSVANIVAAMLCGNEEKTVNRIEWAYSRPELAVSGRARWQRDDDGRAGGACDPQSF